MNTSKLFNLKGITAIITSGANGIGKATAILLVQHGASPEATRLLNFHNFNV